METINAVITGVGGYVPNYILSNDELSRKLDTTNEWIISRIGIQERHILKEEGLGTSYMARKAVKQLLEKTNTKPEEVDLIMVGTSTPDYQIPSTASILCDKLGLINAFAFDVEAACCGFLYLMETAAAFISLKKYKKIIIVGADKMSSIIDYNDRKTCPIFSDGAGAFLIEPTTENMGIIDSYLRTDGKGLPFLHVKAGGSVYPFSQSVLDDKMYYLHQEGRTVFKYAIQNMTDACLQIIRRNHLKYEDIDWIVPHQANIRIIESVSHHLDIPLNKVLINIEHFGNSSAGTLPLCIWSFENKLRKGDNLLFTAFGAGFAWGSMYVRWGYN